MTSYLNLPKSLTTKPKKVADQIYFAYKNKRNIIYIKPIWKYIMRIIQLIQNHYLKNEIIIHIF